MVSFTGSGPVGWAIQEPVPRKHVVLELGGNAAVVVCADWSADDDLDWAASRIATFGNYQAGQSCIGVQRVYARRVASTTRLRDRVVGQSRRSGPATPTIRATARRPDDRRGGRPARRGSGSTRPSTPERTLLTGGERDGTTYAPTVLEDVPADAKVACEEVFGPVLVLRAGRPADEAFARGERLARTGCRPACSPTTCRPRSARTASSRSVA